MQITDYHAKYNLTEKVSVLTFEHGRQGIAAIVAKCLSAAAMLFHFSGITNAFGVRLELAEVEKGLHPD